MEVLHVTDTHLGARWSLVGAPRTLRADDHLRAFELALAPAERGEVGLVIHSGDLFDRSAPDRVAIEGARAALARVARRVPVVVVSGNHDRSGLSAAVGGVDGVVVADRPDRLRIAGLYLGLVPYQRSAAAFADIVRGWGDVDALVAHQAFDGHRVPGFTFRSGRQGDTIGAEHLPPALQHVLCGHLHPRQTVRVGAATVVCPGSTERTGFSEAAQTKGYARWRFARTVTCSLVDLPTRALVEVRAEADLARVGAGDVVLASARWEAAVRARGAYCLLRRAQLSLFTAG